MPSLPLHVFLFHPFFPSFLLLFISSTSFRFLLLLLLVDLFPYYYHHSHLQARRGWTVEHLESGATFEDVDLTEKEWADYDERSDEPVGITEIEHQFIKVK